MIPKERQVQPATTGHNVREAHVEEGGLEEDKETNEEVEIVESEDQQQVEEQQAEKAFQLFHLPSDESITVVIKMMMMTVTMTATELSSLTHWVWDSCKQIQSYALTLKLPYLFHYKPRPQTLNVYTRHNENQK